MPVWLTTTAAKYVGIAVATLMVLLGVYIKGRHDVQVKFDTYKAEVAAAAKVQADEVAKKDAKNEKLIKETKDAYTTQLANLRAYYSLRNGKGSSALPQVSNAPTGTDGYSPDNLPSTPVLASQCAETTLKYVMLQSFILKAQNNAE